MLSDRQTILITGGTSGIGRELARQLHGQGHRMVVLARSQEALARLEEALPGVDTHVCDLGERAAVERTWQCIAGRHPDLSLLINNAAIQHTPRFLDADFDFDGIAREVSVNFTAPAWLCRLALDVFRANGRRSALVNISSGLAFHPKANAAVYCATKAALHSLSQGLRYQLEGSCTTVSEVFLPLVDTPMTARRGAGKISSTQAAREIVQGLADGKQEIFVGKARWLPILQRVAPGVVRAVLRRG